MCLFYLYANAKIEIHICSNKHETGLVVEGLYYLCSLNEGADGFRICNNQKFS